MEQIEESRTAWNSSPNNREQEQERSPVYREGNVGNINIIIWNKKGTLR